MPLDKTLANHPCIYCLKMFSFRADLVPRINGEPICKNCMDKINEKARKRNSLEHYIPPEAYV